MATRCLIITGVLAWCAVLLTGAAADTTTPLNIDVADDEVGGDDVFAPFEGERFDNFDWKMCKLIDNREPGNVVISPIGVKIVLAMLYEGALGGTAREIKNVLELPASRAAVRRRFSTILASLERNTPGSEYVLDIGTKLYVDTSVTPREKYAKIVKTFYNSNIEQIDFSKPAEAAAKINSWVEAVTNGHVQNLVSEADSMSSKVMLLLNAIFFKGLWRYPFNPADTKPGRFNVSPTKSVTASYMKMVNTFYIFDSPVLDAKILRLPYMGKKYAMYIVLPNSPTGLKNLINTITPDGLRHHMWLMEEGRVEITLPKFSFKFNADLSEVLKEMGIKELFTDKALLQGVVEGGRQPARLFVSDVLQKAGLEVGEQGTTAYGVTEVSVVNKFGENDYVFNATHPFMYYIEEEVSGNVIFVGKVVDPSKMDKVSKTSFQAIPGYNPAAINNNQPPTSKPRPQSTLRPRVGTTTNARRPFTEESSGGRQPARQSSTMSTPSQGDNHGGTASAQTQTQNQARPLTSAWNQLFSNTQANH